MVKPLFSGRNDPERGERFSALHEGVPDFLVASLLDWTLEHFLGSLPGKSITNERMILRLERRARCALPPRAKTDPQALVREFQEDGNLLLDAVDLVLSQEDYSLGDYLLNELESILEDAGSAYCVGTDEDGSFELQYRQSEEMSELLDAEADQPGRATEHLRRAWSKCFRRDSEPNDACIEAVKAIEVAARPVIIPDDPVATLGKMCAAISDKPEKWETDSEFDGSVGTVLAMMDMVWKGHYRHGDETAPLEVSQEAAEMTVQTAVLLVSWFRSGRIRLKP